MRQQRQGFMKCWNTPCCFFRKNTPPCWMEKWKIAGSSGRWEIQKMEREGWPARRQKFCVVLPVKRKKDKSRWEETTSPKTPNQCSPTHQYSVVTNVKVLSWVIISQTCCQCPEVFALQPSPIYLKVIAQERTKIYLQKIWAGMLPRQ